MPATDTIDFEREFEELVRELRALPTAAPEQVREKVRALGEPPQTERLWQRFVFFPWRRSLLILAPACVLGLVTAAVIHGVLSSDSGRQAVATVHGEAAQSGARNRLNPSDDEHVFGAATPQTLAPVLPVPSPGRLQDYEATMAVRVDDLDTLTERTNEAIRIARSYGGYVAAVEQSTAAGRPGRADLLLRIPVTHVEDALMRLAGLGTVIDRHLSIRDLERRVQQQRARILQLKLFVARATERLKGLLPADVRLRLELQLDAARSDLSRLTRSNKATLRDASLSRISLTLTTQKAVGAKKGGGSGRVERAARDAADFLAAAGAVVLFLLIILSPVIVLAGAAFWGTRAYRRREERRLLTSA